MSTCLQKTSQNLPKSTKNPPKTASWAHLGASWSLWEASWGVLGGLGASWAHLGASWRRLGASWARLETSWTRFDLNYVKRGPGMPLRLAAENIQFLMKKVTFGKTTYRETTEELCRDRVPLNPDTQLGAFGPGADHLSKCLRQPPHRALKWSVSTCRCDLNVFLCKVFIFFK